MKDILNLSIGELRELLCNRRVSCVEIIQTLFSTIEREDGELHCYLSLNKNAINEAKESDKRIAAEKAGVLEGVPIAVKDNICVRDMPVTCASKMLENFYPPYDATVIERLRGAGAIIIGKTNMDEFACGSSTENSIFGPTRNPFDRQRVPGGSSGGSTAAVGANLAFGALGSDTGGSIRQPAAFCGTVGLKPTFGRVSRYGLIAFSSSLDQIGPITKDVKDISILMNILFGKDPKDSTSVDIAVPDYTDFLTRNIKGLRVGIPKEYLSLEMEKSVRRRMEEVIEIVKKLGADVKDISLPHTKYGIAVYYALTAAEASSNLAKFDGVQYGFRSEKYDNLLEMYHHTRGEGFGEEVKRRIILGTYLLSSGHYEVYYLKAQRVRSLIKKDFTEAFKEVDVIMTPTVPELPFLFGEKTEDPLKMSLSDSFTTNANIAGLPAMNLPVDSVSSLPTGVQIIAPHFMEERIIETAYAIEQELKA